jgi:hypothetical protein
LQSTLTQITGLEAPRKNKKGKISEYNVKQNEVLQKVLASGNNTKNMVIDIGQL